MSSELQEKVINAAKGSRVNQIIARYVLENKNEIIFTTAEKLAQKIGVSQGSVTRFCNALGYTGFGQFQKELQKSHIPEQATAVDRLQYLNNVDQSYVDIIESEKKCMDGLYDVIKSQEYKLLVQRMANAKKVCFLSSRLSASVLDYINYGLSKIRDEVECIKPGSILWDTIEYANPEDILIIAVSFPRYSQDLVGKIKSLHAKGYEIFAITDSALSPIVQHSTQQIFISLTKKSIFDVYSTPVLLFNLLLKDTAASIKDLQKRMENIEKDEKNNKVYYNEK